MFVGAVGGLLLLVFCGIVAVGVQTWLAYNETFGAHAATKDWLHRKITSYSVDAYEELLAVKRLQIYCLRFATKSSTLEDFNIKRRQVVSTFSSFAPNTMLEQELGNHKSFKPAYEAMRLFLQAAEDLEKGSGNIEVAHARGEAAADAWGQFTGDAIGKEYELRDGLESAIVGFRPLAVRAFQIVAVLFGLCVVLIVVAWYAARRALAAERRRFDRFELLLATVGHDLRSPLQALVGAARLAATDGSPEARLKFARIVHERSAFFSRLLDDLINTARSEALSFVPAPLDLDAWFELAEPRYRQIVEAKGLTFRASLKAPPTPILFDSDRLTQVADNLVSNAVRYTDCGSILLVVRCEASASPDGKYELTVEATDTGRGVATADQTRIFEPFVRLDQSVKGMGVGLAMVASIARSAGGAVSLDSVPGTGSTFRFRALVVKSPPNVFARSGRAPAVARPGMALSDAAPVQVPRVLVVDDDPVITEVVAGMLPHMGFEADFANGGRAALEMVLRHSYCAVLTDIEMPDLDGFGLARELRQNVKPCPTLIAMTAYTTRLMSDKRARAFDATLVKPFDEGALLELLDRAATRWSGMPL